MIERYEFSTRILNEALKKVPSIVEKHSKLYSKYNSNSTFNVGIKNQNYETNIDDSSIEYGSANGSSWTIEFDNSLHDYYNWTPEYNEFSFNTSSVAFLVSSEHMLYALYDFNTEIFIIEDTDLSFEVNCIDSLREMIFTLQLEYSDIIETELLWSMLSPMIEFKKLLTPGKDVAIIFEPYRQEFLELNPEIPNV